MLAMNYLYRADSSLPSPHILITVAPKKGTVDQSPRPFDDALNIMLRRESELEAELKHVREVKATLMQASAGANTVPPVVKGQYQGMDMSSALEAYLKSRPGMRIPIAKVTEDLTIGGAKLGTRPEHNLKITVSNHKKLVRRDPVTWDIWLAPADVEPPRKRRQA